MNIEEISAAATALSRSLMEGRERNSLWKNSCWNRWHCSSDAYTHRSAAAADQKTASNVMRLGE